MKAWNKRIIWFFGYYLITILDDYSYFLIHGAPFEHELGTAFITLLILIIPLFFMEDD